jgi:hypothetical protein
MSKVEPLLSVSTDALESSESRFSEAALEGERPDMRRFFFPLVRILSGRGGELERLCPLERGRDFEESNEVLAESPLCWLSDSFIADVG